MVHGTFGRHAAWTGPDSGLSKALAEAGCELSRFAWSGRNSHRARLRAARELTDHLSRRIEENPQAQHWIVAHSHGGNVALHAARDVRQSRRGAPRISTIALATPFINCRARAVPGWLIFVTVLFGPLLFVVAGEKVVTGPRSVLDWLFIVLGALFAADVALCAVGALMHRGFTRPGYRRRLIASIHAPAVAPEELVVVRAAGDEASGLLTAGQFVGWVSAVLSRALTNLLFWGCILLVTSGSVLVSAVFDLRFGLGVLFEVFPIPGFVVVGVIATMLGASMVFGLDGPFVTLFAFSSAEAAPPGEATLMQLEPFAATERRGLAHSRLYNDERVIRSIAEIVRKS